MITMIDIVRYWFLGCLFIISFRKMNIIIGGKHKDLYLKSIKDRPSCCQSRLSVKQEMSHNFVFIMIASHFVSLRFV